LDSGQVHGDEPEPQLPHGVVHLAAKRIGDRPDQVFGWQLHPGDLAVLAYPHGGEAELAQRRFRPVRSGSAAAGPPQRPTGCSS
jgi:hypothetical protein